MGDRPSGYAYLVRDIRPGRAFLHDVIAQGAVAKTGAETWNNLDSAPVHGRSAELSPPSHYRIGAETQGVRRRNFDVEDVWEEKEAENTLSSKPFSRMTCEKEGGCKQKIGIILSGK
jgi:hypothetical protein